MTADCLTCGRCAAPADRPGAARRLIAGLLLGLGAALRRPTRRKQVRNLLDLDDYLLADIGVTRDEAHRAQRDRLPLRRPDWPEPAAPAVRIGPL